MEAVGGDVDGKGDENADGWYVHQLAVGNKVVIGVPFCLYSDGKNVGSVRVIRFRSKGKGWVRLGQDLTGTDHEEEFGLSLSH